MKVPPPLKRPDAKMTVPPPLNPYGKIPPPPFNKANHAKMVPPPFNQADYAKMSMWCVYIPQIDFQSYHLLEKNNPTKPCGQGSHSVNTQTLQSP